MQVQEVNIEKLDPQTELSDTFLKTCCFCNKLVKVKSEDYLVTRAKKFHCSHCLRHNFQHKFARHVLPMSFRGVIGQYYYENYMSQNNRGFKKLWVAQIKAMIDKHVEIGLYVPAFIYDPSTFLWFIDFNRIGDDTKKFPYPKARDTIYNMFLSFKVSEIVSQQASVALWDKFDKALTLFHEQRKRPQDRPLLVPTFCGISHHHNKDESFERARNFTKNCLIVK